MMGGGGALLFSSARNEKQEEFGCPNRTTTPVQCLRSLCTPSSERKIDALVCVGMIEASNLSQ